LDAFASLVGTEWGRDFSRFVRQEQTLRGSLNTGFTHNGARLGATL
jgi:dolichol kinase